MTGPTGTTGPYGQGYATLVASNSQVLYLGQIGYQLSGSFNAIPTMQMGNVLRVDQVYGNDSTAYIGGLPYATIQAAITAVIGTGTVATPQFSNQAIWVLPGVYTISPTGTNATITTNIGETLYPLLQLPSTTALRGISLQTCTIQCANPTQNTALFSIQPNTRIEDLTMVLGSSTYSGSNNLVGLYFSSTSTVSSKIRTSTINLSNASMAYTSSNNLYGCQFDGTGGSFTTFSFNCVKGCTVSVYGNGSGTKRGMIVTNSNIATLRDTNIYVAAPPTNSNFAGSYVGIETRDANNLGSIQLRSTTVGSVQPTGNQTYTASDILQTNPTTITNPTYLASAGIQVGPGTDLVTKTAGGKGFSTYVYPTTLFYGAMGTLNTSGNPGTGTPAYLWPGSVVIHSSGGQFIQYPDVSTPAAYYRVQQPLILSGMSVACVVSPGTGHTTTLTVQKTPSGGSIADTVYSLVLSNATTSLTKYDASVNFAAGDYIHVRISYDAAGNTTQDISVQLDCF
jgi:hypothetical protein